MSHQRPPIFRALIIAIENYESASSGIARQLNGTHAAAVDFRKWLVKRKCVPKENIMVCSESPDFPGRTHGATADQISRAVYDLWDQGKGRTDELFFYFSGHGFLYEESEARNEVADVLVGAEFVDPNFSGNACRKLPEIQQHLRSSMGPGEHFYFINACRNKMKEGDITPGVLGLKPQRASNGDANPFTLYSTQPGAFAAVSNRFSNFLVQGLRGTDIAMTWANGDLVVSVSSLERFLKARMSEQEVDSRPGRGPGIIQKIVPIRKFVCAVEVVGAAAGDEFQIQLTTARGQDVKLATDRFSGPRFKLPRMTPDKYLVAVFEGGAELVPEDSAAVELFGPRKVRFRRGDDPNAAGLAEAVGMASVTISSVPASEIEVLDLVSGEKSKFSMAERAQMSQRLQPGRYEFSVRAPDGALLKSRELQLKPGEGRSLSLKPTSRRPVKQVIRSKFGSKGGQIDFSESLGEIADQDLAVWLAIMGGSRIVGGKYHFSQLRPLPLAHFDDAQEGDAPIYVLSALRGVDGPIRFGLSRDAGPSDWVKASPVDGFPGLQQLVLKTEPGRQLLSYAKPGGASRTLVTHTLANRATLVTISDSASELRVHQYILPIWGLRDHCPAATRRAVMHKPLRRVLEMARAQARYGRQEVMEGGDRFWNKFLYDQRLDPLTAVLAAYELVRRGRLEEVAKVVSKLHFAKLPDTKILARLAGLEAAGDGGVPLVLDGLLSRSESTELPLPEAFLDYTGIWTSWRGAVKVGRLAAEVSPESRP